MNVFRDDGFYVAFDTSGSVGSVAVGSGGEVLARVGLQQRGEHAARLVPAIEEVLEQAGVDRDEVSGVVVGEGPGSFTGVRVAAATAKGLVYGLQCPLWAISSLAATSLALDGGGIRYVLFDARGDRVYGACYGIGSIGIETLVPPHGGALRDVLDSDVPAGAVFVGDGADRHSAAIVGAGFEVVSDPVAHPTADALLRFLSLHPETLPIGSVNEWEPRYIREWQPDSAWRG
jgi:tRNA threonylcarbamoyladenosine biosynthesis protein TsaB